MKTPALDKVPILRDAGGSHFPLRFSCQPGPCPTGVRVRFEITDMTDRLMQRHWPKAGKSKIPPTTILLLPIERRAPFLFIDREPSQRQPQFGPLVAAILHERQVLLVRDQPGSQLKPIQKFFMSR